MSDGSKWIKNILGNEISEDIFFLALGPKYVIEPLARKNIIIKNILADVNHIISYIDKSHAKQITTVQCTNI